jgi:hypothetical protein
MHSDSEVDAPSKSPALPGQVLRVRGLGVQVLTFREVPRLEELRLQALQTRIEADLWRGRHAEVAAELERLVAVHPLREHLHALLMLALFRGAARGMRWPSTDASARC